MTNVKLHSLSSASALVGAMLLATAVPAFAQDAAATGASATAPGKEEITPTTTGGESGDVIVTARKRAEDIQTVPISITALTSRDLEERSINSLLALSNATPGFAFTSAAAGNTGTIVLRGIAPAVTQNDLNVDANVGTFIDGIYQTSRNTLDIISILDVGQIEIAKGPQSALYGRSTFAGAIGISTRRPSHTWEGSITGTVAEDSDYRIRGTVSGPIVDGLLYARVAGGYLTYDGFGKNAAEPNNNLAGFKKYGGTGSLEFTPSEKFTALLSGYYTRTDNEMSAITLLPNTAFNCGVPSVAFGGPLLFCGQLPAKKVADISPGIPKTIMKTSQIALNMNYDAGFAHLISVTGFTRASSLNYNDYDGTSAGLLFGVCTATPANANCVAGSPYVRTVRANLISSGREKVRSFSQELRIQADEKARFQWLLGGYYFNSRVPLNNTAGIGVDQAGLGPNDRYLAIYPVQTVPNFGPFDATANLFQTPNSLTSQAFASYSKAQTRTKSVFGQLGYTLGNLRASAEGRYSWDTKYAQTFSVATPATLSPGAYPQIAGLIIPAAGTFPIIGPEYRKTFKVFTPRFTLDLQAMPGMLLYLNAAKGARAGGFNTNPVSATGILASEVAYDSETNWTYEAGLKSRFLDRRVLLNFSIFHTDWKNTQISAFTQNPAIPSTVVPSNITRNAGNVQSTGIESQIEAKVNDLLGVGGSVTYADPKFKAGTYDASQIARCRLGATPATYTAAPGCPQIIAVSTPNGGTQYVPTLEGKTPLRATKIQWNVHATLGTELANSWRLSGRVDVNYTGRFYINNINTSYVGSHTLTNLRLGIDTKNVAVALFGTNIFDKTYVQNAINQPRADLPTGNNIPEIYLGQGRQLGLTATLKY